jgi:4-hydroxy-tetrahydrodipicolinate reductase
VTHRIALFGVTGRMGRSVLKALSGCGDLVLSGATASAGSSHLGEVVSAETGATVTVGGDPRIALLGAQTAIDFSHSNAVTGNLAACVASRTPVVIAVTGLDPAAREAISEASKLIPIVLAANTSLGVTVMLKIAALAAAALPPDSDTEISEAHHRMKRDAPSGTAISLGEAVAAARGTSLQDAAVFSRHGNIQPRLQGTIGFSVVRAGDIVGVHTLLYAGEDETLEITHRVSDRICFARGALAAAHWLVGRPAGLYAMDDVLQKLA